jgi:hypothetical protein
LHIDEVFFPHNGFQHETQVFCDGVSIAFTYDLTRVLDGKLDFQILVPVGVDIQFAFPNPLGIVFIDVFDLKIMRDIEFFQSCQD